MNEIQYNKRQSHARKKYTPLAINSLTDHNFPRKNLWLRCF